MGSQQPQEYEFSGSSSEPSISRDSARTKRREDFRKLVDLFTFPIYTAIGIGDAIIDAFDDVTEKTLKKARERKIATSLDEWQDSVEEEVDRIHSKLDKSFDRWKSFVTFDTETSEQSTKHTLEDLYYDVVDSAGKFVQSLAQRGVEVSPIKPSHYSSSKQASDSVHTDIDSSSEPEN